MANENKPFGMKAIESPHVGVRRHRYPVLPQSLWSGAAADLSARIYLGDPVFVQTAGLILPVDTQGISPMGVVEGIFDPAGKPVRYVPTALEDEWYKYFLLIADDPHQLFTIQEDSVGGSVSQENGNPWHYANLAMSPTGNAVTGRSGFMLDSSTVGSGPGQLQFLDRYALEHNEFGDYCVWVVKFGMHRFA